MFLGDELAKQRRGHRLSVIIPYLILFAVTAVLVAIAGSRNNRSALLRWVASVVAILLVSVFAGIRDFHVGGPDVEIYGNKVFDNTLRMPQLDELISYADERSFSGEFGYYLLNWLVGRATTDPHVLYTVLAALNATCILIAILLVREYGAPIVMWLTYMFTAYIEGFNLLRQSSALALAVLGIALVLRDRMRLGLIVGASGLLFHDSAVVFFIMWGTAVYLKTRREHIGRAVYVVMFLSMASLVAVAPALELLGGSLGDSKYQEYLVGGARTGRAIGIDAFYRVVPIAVGIIALAATRPREPAKRQPGQLYSLNSGHTAATLVTESDTDAKATAAADLLARRAVLVVLVLLSLELIFLQVREISYPFYRLLAYFGYVRIIGYAMIANLVGKTYRVAAGVGAVAFAAAYFWLIVIDRNEAVYESAILDIWLKAFG